MQYLLCTTLYDSSTTPALLCTAKNYSVLFQYYSRTTKYYNIPLYYKVLLQCYSVLKSTTPELLCTKVALTIDPPHIWNIIYIARSNRCHPPASPNIAPATQNDSHHWSSHIWNVSFNARRSRHHPPTSPNTAPATQNCNPKSKRNLPKLVDDSSMIRVRLSMELQNWTRPLAEVTAPPIGNAFPIKNMSCSSYLSKFHQILRLPKKMKMQHHQVLPLPWTVTLQHHQMLRLPRKMTLMIEPAHIRNVIHIAQRNRQHPPPHQILRLPRKTALPNLREFCGKQLKPHFQRAADLTMIRAWSDHDPNMNSSSRTRPFAGVTFRGSGRILYWALRLSIQVSPGAVPATKSHTPTSPNAAPPTKIHTPTPPNAAPATKNDTPTAPNTAPATKNDSHDWSCSHMKRHLQRAEQQESPSNFTKYCACNAKWLSWLTLLTYETSSTSSTARGGGGSFKNIGNV